MYLHKVRSMWKVKWNCNSVKYARAITHYHSVPHFNAQLTLLLCPNDTFKSLIHRESQGVTVFGMCFVYFTFTSEILLPAGKNSVCQLRWCNPRFDPLLKAYHDLTKSTLWNYSHECFSYLLFSASNGLEIYSVAHASAWTPAMTASTTSTDLQGRSSIWSNRRWRLSAWPPAST